MKKRLVLLLVTAMAATTVLAGCGSKDSGSSDNGKKSSKEAKIENDDDTLIVGFDASFPPYGYKDDSGDPNYFSKIFKKRTGFSPSFYSTQEGDQ